jgi:hypothetical protein
MVSRVRIADLDATLGHPTVRIMSVALSGRAGSSFEAAAWTRLLGAPEGARLQDMGPTW